jgi:hypothetical protein
VSTLPGTVNAHRATVAVLVPWFLLALGASLLGVFDRFEYPVPMGLAAVLPVAIFALAYRRSVAVRRYILSLDLRLVVLAQTWRVGGIVFVILYAYGALPGVFALPAGWGDFAIGVTAPALVWVLLAGVAVPRTAFAAWNVLGIFDLVLAVSLGALASSTRFGILAGETTTQIMGEFPLSLIPTFLVPLWVILHLVALVQLRGTPVTAGSHIS